MATLVATEVMEGPRKNRPPTIPPANGGLRGVDVEVDSVATLHSGHGSGSVTQPIDPNMSLLLKGIEGLQMLAQPLSEVAKQPGGKGPVVVAVVAAFVCSLVFSIAAVWVHDQTTSGRIGARLEAQDETISDVGTQVEGQNRKINALVNVVGGLIDEGDEDMAWIEDALAAGFSGQPIPKRNTRGRDKLRRMLPPQ
jgi:hypothetical protein